MEPQGSWTRRARRQKRHAGRGARPSREFSEPNAAVDPTRGCGAGSSSAAPTDVGVRERPRSGVMSPSPRTPHDPKRTRIFVGSAPEIDAHAVGPTGPTVQRKATPNVVQMRSESGMRVFGGHRSAPASRHRQCPSRSAGSTGEWGRSEARASSGSCCSIPPDALVRRACVGHCMPWRPPWVRTRTPLAVASCGGAAQQCNNGQTCAMKTASALTVVKILVVHSRFPFANFHGHLGSP